VRLDGPAVEAELAVVSGGGDFADGGIAFNGSPLGTEVFCSFPGRPSGWRRWRAGGGSSCVGWGSAGADVVVGSRPVSTLWLGGRRGQGRALVL